MKNFILTLALSLTFSALSFGQTDADYTKTLKKMFTLSGTEESYKYAIKQMFVIFKEQSPFVEASVWEEFEKEFSSTSIDKLVEMLAPVYQKYMTQVDLEEMIIFYQTPVGKKYAKNLSMIMQESMEIGQQWGMKIGQEIAYKLKEKGN